VANLWYIGFEVVVTPKNTQWLYTFSW